MDELFFICRVKRRKYSKNFYNFVLFLKNQKILKHGYSLFLFFNFTSTQIEEIFSRSLVSQNSLFIFGSFMSCWLVTVSKLHFSHLICEFLAYLAGKLYRLVKWIKNWLMKMNTKMWAVIFFAKIFHFEKRKE